MDHYDYKAIPAPRRCKKSKNVRDPYERFALTLSDALNEQARDGWEYVRAETMPAETPRGFFRRATEEDMTLLIFRRLRESREPRLDSRAREPAESGVDPRPVPKQRAEPSIGGVRSFEERVQHAGAARREPRVPEPNMVKMAEFGSPLRSAPKLDPVEPS
jgi:hypothetical protein